MRRIQREIKQPGAIEAILEEAAVMRLGLDDAGVPYIVPLNFGYSRGFIYIHSALEGRKLDIIRRNNLVCFEVEGRTELVKGGLPCEWGMRFESVIGYGRADLVLNETARMDALNIIMRKYSGRSFEIGEYSPEALGRTAVVRISVQSMTGKKS
jgi:uncharacterized protein